MVLSLPAEAGGLAYRASVFLQRSRSVGVTIGERPPTVAHGAERGIFFWRKIQGRSSHFFRRHSCFAAPNDHSRQPFQKSHPNMKSPRSPALEEIVWIGKEEHAYRNQSDPPRSLPKALWPLSPGHILPQSTNAELRPHSSRPAPATACDTAAAPCVLENSSSSRTQTTCARQRGRRRVFGPAASLKCRGRSVPSPRRHRGARAFAV